jgi:hypothetical protein
MQSNIAPRRETVKPLNRVSRQHAFAPQSRQSHLLGMRDLPAQRRAALKAFIDSYGHRKRNWVAIKAKVSESALRAFLAGKTTHLEERTYDSLAAWSSWTVAELKGETEKPTSDDIASRKSVTNGHHDNDLLSGIGQSAPGTDRSPESEGNEMADRLFIEILDKIDGLPPGHLHRLRVLIDKIDNTQGRAASPHLAGTAE